MKTSGLTIQVTDDERSFLSDLCERESRGYKQQFMWMARERARELGMGDDNSPQTDDVASIAE